MELTKYANREMRPQRWVVTEWWEDIAHEAGRPLGRQGGVQAEISAEEPVPRESERP
ncbi:MAG: hypothetical protein AAB308_18290 [Nitrospirota bacterium]